MVTAAPAARSGGIIRDIAAGRRYVDPDIAASALTGDDCPLTDRELEVLRAARAGASIAEIAVEGHLAPGAVQSHLSVAMSKRGGADAPCGRAPGVGARLDLIPLRRPVGDGGQTRPAAAALRSSSAS
ncbi:hypothetical protein GCM10010321_40270 [Streptomyces chartreusis]|nr:hypothetical protein GCM10010321_40270 [Streptomyces chartreusis]